MMTINQYLGFMQLEIMRIRKICCDNCDESACIECPNHIDTEHEESIFNKAPESVPKSKKRKRKFIPVHGYDDGLRMLVNTDYAELIDKDTKGITRIWIASPDQSGKLHVTESIDEIEEMINGKN